MNRNQEYKMKAHQYIPAGAHTYSRTDEVFSVNTPAVIERCKGAWCWDVEGNKWLDFGMACRSVTVGYNFDRISKAAIEQIYNGNTATKASKVEVDAAELMCNLIPWVDMVKFAKNGSTVTTAAIKLARAYTGKEYVVRCRQHSFFSYDDWFIGATVMDSGIPKAISKYTVDFDYNDIASVKKVFEQYKGNVAAIILEPVEFEEPKNNFLQEIRKLCDEYNVVYILDEMITGFRWDLQGACKYYDVIPDLVTYGKGMANGFSVAALGGKREIMELGGLEHSHERVFLISTTHGAEMSSLGALMETVAVYKELNVTQKLWKSGAVLSREVLKIAKEYGIEKEFYFEGADCSPNYVTKDRNGNASNDYRTLFQQEMIKNGVIMSCVSLCYEHGDEEIDIAISALRKSLKVYAEALNSDINRYLEGRAIKPVFRKYN